MFTLFFKYLTLVMNLLVIVLSIKHNIVQFITFSNGPKINFRETNISYSLLVDYKKVFFSLRNRELQFQIRASEYTTNLQLLVNTFIKFGHKVEDGQRSIEISIDTCPFHSTLSSNSP